MTFWVSWGLFRGGSSRSCYCTLPREACQHSTRLSRSGDPGTFSFGGWLGSTDDMNEAILGIERNHDLIDRDANIIGLGGSMSSASVADRWKIPSREVACACYPLTISGFVSLFLLFSGMLWAQSCETQQEVWPPCAPNAIEQSKSSLRADLVHCTLETPSRILYVLKLRR